MTTPSPRPWLQDELIRVLMDFIERVTAEQPIVEPAMLAEMADAE